MKHVILYFGSFNPIHKGHTALAEYVLRQGLGDEVVLVVSPGIRSNRPPTSPRKRNALKWPKRPAKPRRFPTASVRR